MRHESVFQPRLEVAGLTDDEWDRLPWLQDEPRVRPKRRVNKLLSLLLLLAVTDASLSYAAGRISDPAAPDRAVVVKAEASMPRRLDAQSFSKGLATPPDMAWYRQHPGAPY